MIVPCIFLTTSSETMKVVIVFIRFNYLLNDMNLDWSKLKAFKDDKINVTQKLKIVLKKIENTVGKEENADIQHFLLFPQCFQKPSFQES